MLGLAKRTSLSALAAPAPVILLLFGGTYPLWKGAFLQVVSAYCAFYVGAALLILLLSIVLNRLGRLDGLHSVAGSFAGALFCLPALWISKFIDVNGRPDEIGYVTRSVLADLGELPVLYLFSLICLAITLAVFWKLSGLPWRAGGSSRSQAQFETAAPYSVAVAAPARPGRRLYSAPES